MTNDGANSTANHSDACAETIWLVDIVPAYRNTATNDRPIEISYEIIWALERSPPSSG